MVGVEKSLDVQAALGLGGGLRRSGMPSSFALSLVLVLFVFSGVAQAAPETIADFGTGAGQVSLPDGVAVDQTTGHVYVAEGNNFRVSKFDSNGNFLLAFGYGVADGVTKELQACGPAANPPTKFCFAPNFYPLILSAGSVAVDEATGDVYVSDNSNARIVKFNSSGEVLYMVGRNVNKTKVEEGGATQAEKNVCTAASGDSCGSGESGSGPDEFSSSLSPIAVSAAGVVWVGDLERLVSFNANGDPGVEIALPGGGITRSLALDSAGNFFVVSQSAAGVRKLEAGTGTELDTLDAGGQASTVTVTKDDTVYVGDSTSPYRFKVYDSAGEQILQFGAGQVIGAPGDLFLGGNAIAVAEGPDKLFTASSRSSEAESVVQAFPLPEPGPLPEDQHVENLLPTTATLAATLNPEGHETTYHFEWGTTNSYGQDTPTESLGVTAFEPENVEAPLEQLIPETTYHFRLVATNHCDPAEPSEECTVAGPDTTFTTLPAVAIDAQWATNIDSQGALLHAELNPLGIAGEWWLEYGTTVSYGVTTTPEALPASFGDVAVSELLSGLQAAATYHYRFIARDERDGVVYTVHGADHAFTTQVGGLGFQLADNRAWEMVSPADKHGARLVGGGEVHLQASADGEGLAYQSLLSTETDPEGNRILEPSMNLAHREADGLWRSKDITPPNQRVTPIAIGQGTEYRIFNSDLSEALLEPRSGAPLSVEASERTPYLRQNTEPPLYTPLITGKAPYANVPPGTEFGGGDHAVGDVTTVGVSPDFRHFAFVSNVPLVEGAPGSVQTLYEWSNGQIDPVSVLPASEGGGIVEAHFVGSGRGSVRGALSTDGSRVFWSTGLYGSTSALYIRDTEAGESARLDVVQPGASGAGTARPVFQGASADGSVVFFTDSQQLTENASSESFDLYRCQLPLGSVAAGCTTLTDISVATAYGERADVIGILPALAEDGNTVYVVARGILDGASNPSGDKAVSGNPNLYVWQQGKGMHFVAALSVEDVTDWGGATTGLGLELSAAASPSGRYLAFMSQRSLTGYDNRNKESGEAGQEVFRYDAFADQLVCVSCNPAGVRPRAPILPSNDQTLFNPGGLWGGQPVAATLPEATAISLSGISLYRPRAVLNNGRVFFNAIDAVVPADSNGQWDVYQYEPTGVGDCLAASGGASISRSAGGCVSPISSGTAKEEAAFFDADETGDNAFFFTPAQLSVLDEDQEVDIYDARVGGIPATLPINAECLGEACQPLLQSPNDATPASAAFKGAGNLHPRAKKHCSKGKRRMRRHGKVRCVAKKRHRAHGGHGKHRKAGSHRRLTR